MFPQIRESPFSCTSGRQSLLVNLEGRGPRAPNAIAFRTSCKKRQDCVLWDFLVCHDRMSVAALFFSQNIAIIAFINIIRVGNSLFEQHWYCFIRIKAEKMLCLPTQLCAVLVYGADKGGLS